MVTSFVRKPRTVIGHAGRDGDRHHLRVEPARLLGGAGLLLAFGAVAVHALARDPVALGHLLGGLQHRPVDLGLVLHEPAVGQHVLVGLVLHARDALDATGHVDVGLAGDDALRGHRDGLQAARAEPVHGGAADRDRQAGAQRDLARDVGAGRALGVGAPHQHVLHIGAVDAGTLDRGTDGVAAERGAVGHVEGALPALGERRAGGGDDDGIGHDRILRRRSCSRRPGGPAAARAARSSASSRGFRAKRFIACTTLKRPCVSA